MCKNPAIDAKKNSSKNLVLKDFKCEDLCHKDITRQLKQLLKIITYPPIHPQVKVYSEYYFCIKVDNSVLFENSC